MRQRPTTVLLKFEGVTVQTAAKIETTVQGKCKHLARGFTGDTAKFVMVFDISRKTLEEAFSKADELGLQKRLMTRAELEKDRNAQFADSGYIVSRPPAP